MCHITNINFVSLLQTRSARPSVGTASSGNILPGMFSVSDSNRTSLGNSTEPWVDQDDGLGDDVEREETSPHKRGRYYMDAGNLMEQ